MAKRMRTSSGTNASGAESEHASPTSPLLSLPSELRFMIWKAVVADPLLLIPTGYAFFTGSEGWQVSGIRPVALDPDYLNHSCSQDHQSRTARRKRNKNDPLRWLRTNRQIYTEARPLVFANLSLHICDSLVRAALVGRKAKLEPSLIHFESRKPHGRRSHSRRHPQSGSLHV